MLLLGLGRLSAAYPQANDGISTTRHRIIVDGKPLQYIARAGRIPILDNETGEVHGWMFFTSYSLYEGPAGRPVTFLWNGGPGSSSSLVHLLGFGPRRLDADGDAHDNQGTWLDFTDLVFIDPIGTGYSRPSKAEYGKEFYQTRGDAESVAEFIRVYRNRYQIWNSPLYLTGESYGVVRAAGVADVLQRRGIKVSGIVLIGLALPLASFSEEQRAAFALPTWTAAAWANQMLPKDLMPELGSALRQSEAWAAGDYAKALARKDQLTIKERDELVQKLSRFTGMEANVIDRKTMSIRMEDVSGKLLASRNLVVGRYDSRLTGPRDPGETSYDPTRDPSLKNIINDTGVSRYFRNELNYESDLQYQGPFGGGYPPPSTPRGDWMSTRWDFGNPEIIKSGNISALGEASMRRALAANPELRVLSACGYFDLVCSYFGNYQAVEQLESGVKGRVAARAYAGGHALYTDPVAQMKLKNDVAEFMKRATR